MTDNMKRVFICYSRNDWPLARQLLKQLGRKHLVEMDTGLLQPGDAWDEVVRKSIRNADLIVVVVSPMAIASHQVKDEIEFAHAQGKKIVPVLLENSNTHPLLEKIHHVDARYSPGAAIDTIESILDNRARPSGNPIQLVVPARKKNWGVLAVFDAFSAGVQAPLALRLIYAAALLSIVANFCTVFVLGYHLKKLYFLLGLTLPFRQFMVNLLLTRRLSLSAATYMMLSGFVLQSLTIAVLGWGIDARGLHEFLALNVLLDALLLVGLLALPSIRHWLPYQTHMPQTWRSLFSRYAEP